MESVAPDDVMRVTLGVNTCFAVKRWPEPSVWTAIVRDELGIELVQHSFDLVDLDAEVDEALAEAHAVRRACQETGLTLHSTFTGLAAYSSNLLLAPDPGTRRRALRWYHRAIEWTAAAGGLATGGHVGAYSVSDWRTPVRRDALEEELHRSLGELATRARQAGLEYLMFENLAAAREPATMTQVRALLDHGSPERVPLRLCLDVGHQCVAGTRGDERDPYAWLVALGAEAPVVQLQQSDAVSDHHWPFTPEANARGRIEAPAVLEALRSSGAREVALVLEVIPAFEADDDEVLSDMATSARYWRDALATAGLGP